MSGHNKWSSIKHKKGAADAKRGKIFTKLVKEITVAAREGGGDPETNPRLRLAIANAKNANMSSKNVDNAIKKGTGELEGVNYENVTYEGYGQGGVAVIVEALTDNKQRTVAEVRHAFSKFGGNLAENGAVSFMFEKKGLIEVLAEDRDEDEVMMEALEAGADDIEKESSDSLTALWESQAELLVGPNRDKAKLLRQTFITPSCGTGSLKPEPARKVLELTRAVSDNLRAKYLS